MNNETQQTAVDWYAEKSIILFDNFQTGKINFKEWFKQYAILLEQAKDMEREQHKKTYFDSTSQFDNSAEMTYKKSFDEYYNETYGGNK
jgi:hypothetical protein